MVAASLVIQGSSRFDARTRVVKTAACVALSMIAMPGYINTLYDGSSIPTCQTSWTWQFIPHSQALLGKLRGFVEGHTTNLSKAMLRYIPIFYSKL